MSGGKERSGEEGKEGRRGERRVGKVRRRLVKVWGKGREVKEKNGGIMEDGSRD